MAALQSGRFGDAGSRGRAHVERGKYEHSASHVVAVMMWQICWSVQSAGSRS